MKRLNILIIALMATAIRASEMETLERMMTPTNPEDVLNQPTTSNVPGFSSKQAPALPSRIVVGVKPWLATNTLASKLPKKDKQKLEALLASAEGLLASQGNAVQEHRDRFNATWKALSDQIGRSNWNVSITGRLAGIEWRDRLLGLRTSLEHILGTVNAGQAYDQQALRSIIDAISELISKINGKLGLK